MDKPRLTYAQVFGMTYEKGSAADFTDPMLADWREGTIAWFTERKIADSHKLGARPLPTPDRVGCG